MEDFISYSKIAELLTKALRDELTDEEREVLERWRHEASVHEAFYRRVNTPEFLEEHPQHRFEGEIAEAWGRLYVRHRSRRRRLVAIRWSVAAMVAIVLGGVALWQSGGESRPLSQTLVQEHAVIEPGSRQAELVLGNGRTVKLGEHAQPRLLEVDGAVIKMDEKRLEYREEKEVDRLVFNTLRIPRGGEYSILLSDGTKVFLGIEAVVPGFGFFGVTGLISLLAGSYYLLGGGAEAAYILLGVVLALGAVVALLFVYLPAESKWNPFVLWEKQENRHGYTGAEDHSQYLGKRGEVVAPLRPAGTVIIDGERVDVVSFGDYIMPGALVEIVKVEGNKLFVQEVKTN